MRRPTPARFATDHFARLYDRVRREQLWQNVEFVTASWAEVQSATVTGRCYSVFDTVSCTCPATGICWHRIAVHLVLDSRRERSEVEIAAATWHRDLAPNLDATQCPRCHEWAVLPLEADPSFLVCRAWRVLESGTWVCGHPTLVVAPASVDVALANVA